MRSLFLSMALAALSGLGISGGVQAQVLPATLPASDSTSIQQAGGTFMTSESIRQVSHVSVANAGIPNNVSSPASLPIQQVHACGNPACHNPGCCAPCTKKVCIPEPTKKEIKKTIYGCKTVDFCPRGCCHHDLLGKLRSCFSKMCAPTCGNDCEPCATGHHGCQTCDNNCGHPRTKRVLLKKRISCGFEEGVKCKVVEQPIEHIVPCEPPCTTPQACPPAACPPAACPPACPPAVFPTGAVQQPLASQPVAGHPVSQRRVIGETIVVMPQVMNQGAVGNATVVTPTPNR